MTVIFKLGGSVLTQPGLSDRLLELVEHRSDQQRLMIVGGGTVVDVIRDWSRIHELDDESAHWLAISGMDLNRHLIERLTNWSSVSSRKAAREIWSTTNLPLLLDMTNFAANEESDGEFQLPHNWNVTSDSLAAWVAVRWPVDELVLVKSAATPSGLNLEQAASANLVDNYFPEFAHQQPLVSWCNLRDSKITIAPLW